MRKRYNPNKLYKSICKEWNQTIEGWEEELRKKVLPLFALGKEDQVSGYQLVVSLGEGGLCEFIEPREDKFHLKRGVPFNLVPLILRDVGDKNSVWYPLYKGGFFSDLLYPMKLIPNADFYMGIYEVTQDLYKMVMGKNPSYFKGANRPVEKVNWYDAVEFCNKLSKEVGLEPVYYVYPTAAIPLIKKLFDGEYGGLEEFHAKYKHLAEDIETIDRSEWEDYGVIWNRSAKGYRLPTDMEWEYAARGGESYLYSGSDDLDDVGWYDENSGDETHPVGRKKSNGFGLYDMSGNVWEWCWDKWGKRPSGPRVNRGGGWLGHVRYARVSYRAGLFESMLGSSLGFRMARNA